jgi:hypothetical protein
MNINLDEIQKKYPKGYNKFLDFLRYNNCIMYCDYTIRYKDVSIGFLFIYALLEKFFDDNGIIIRYKFYKITGMHSYIIYNKKYAKIIKGKYQHTNYEYCKKQAICKAFEIL